MVPDRWTETLWTTGEQLRFQKANSAGQVQTAVIDLMSHHPGLPNVREGDRLVIVSVELITDLLKQTGYTQEPGEEKF